MAASRVVSLCKKKKEFDVTFKLSYIFNNYWTNNWDVCLTFHNQTYHSLKYLLVRYLLQVKWQCLKKWEKIGYKITTSLSTLVSVFMCNCYKIMKKHENDYLFWVSINLVIWKSYIDNDKIFDTDTLIRVATCF